MNSVRNCSAALFEKYVLSQNTAAPDEAGRTSGAAPNKPARRVTKVTAQTAQTRQTRQQDDNDIQSYLVYPEPGQTAALVAALAQIPGCDVIPSVNRNVLVLVTESS